MPEIHVKHTSHGPISKPMKSIAGVSILMSLILLAFVVQQPAGLVAGAFLCAFYALANYSSARVLSVPLLVASALFLPAFLNPNHGFSPVFYFFSTLSVFFAANVVTKRHPEVLLAAFRLIYTGAVVAISVILYKYWGDPEPFGRVIEGSSTNGIPAYLIVIQIGLSLCGFLVTRRLPVLSPIATAAVAFYGNGRGSLVVAGLIIVVSLFFNLRLTGSISRKRQLLFIFLIALTAILLAWSAEELVDLLFSYTKLSVGLVDENRLEIWNQYLDKIGPWTLFFGASYDGTVIDSVYQGNPHIAFIRTHSFFGLPLTVIALISPIFVFFSRKTLTAKLVFACFIALAALRALSEPILFPTLLDFFYFTYFFLFFRYAPVGIVSRKGSAVPSVRS